MGVENLVSWTNVQLDNSKERFDRQKRYVISEMEDLTRRLEDGRLYSSDAENMSRALRELENMRQEVEYNEEKVGFVGLLLEEVRKEAADEVALTKYAADRLKNPENY